MRAFVFAALLALASGTGAAAQVNIICTLIIDARTSEVLLEEGDCTTPVTPASTFKVPLAVMGFDAGILTDAHTPIMAFRQGDPDWVAEWRRDTDPAAWMRYSVLWYSQRIAHQLGAEGLTRYARDFGYGNADFSGDPGQDNGLMRSWVSSSLRISPHQQAQFMRALALDALPVSPRAMALTREIMDEHHAGDWVIHGKTGTAYPRRADRSFDYARGWGWYVGWAEQGDRVLVVVRLGQATERRSGSLGAFIRDGLLREWPRLTGVRAAAGSVPPPLRPAGRQRPPAG